MLATAAGPAKAAPLDEPFVGGLSFDGPTSANLGAVYWNPAALGLVRGFQLMAAVSARRSTIDVNRAPIDPMSGAPGGSMATGSARALDFSGPSLFGPHTYFALSTDFGGDRFTIAFATYMPYLERITYPLSPTHDEPTRYHALKIDLRNLALVPALSIRFGNELRVGLAPGFMFSTGQLSFARRRLAHAIDAIEPAVRAGMPVVVLEPSCAAVLRDDVRSLLSDRERVRAVTAATHTLAELLDRHAPAWSPGRLDRRVVVQTHCHQHAVLGSDADDRVLERAGASVERLDAGCCGMAGNFGFEASHYDVSVAVAEHAMLPALNAEPAATTVLADGFSCRTQIEQLAGRRAVHLAELLREAMGPGDPPWPGP